MQVIKETIEWLRHPDPEKVKDIGDYWAEIIIARRILPGAVVVLIILLIALCIEIVKGVI